MPAPMEIPLVVRIDPLAPLTLSVPVNTFVLPLYELAPLRTVTPLPPIVRLPAPEITPLKVREFAELFAQVSFAPRTTAALIVYVLGPLSVIPPAPIVSVCVPGVSLMSTGLVASGVNVRLLIEKFVPSPWLSYCAASTKKTSSPLPGTPSLRRCRC